MRTPSFVDSLREPAFTGSNRCLPCTVINLGLVGASAGLLWTAAPVVGVVWALLGVVTVWLRGYVVPGTPQLTRRYLPPVVLGWLGKRPAGTPPEGDPTTKLVAFGVLTDDEEPRLTPSFRSAWMREATTLGADAAACSDAAAAVLSVDADDVAVTTPDDGGVVLSVDGSWVGQWPSRTALVADLATERTLAGPDWDALGRTERVDLAARIRGLTEHCPACGGSTQVSADTVSSCCHTTDVVAVSCADCGDRLAEFDPSPSTFAAGM